MQDYLMAAILTFHTTNIILNDNSKFSFVGSIPKAMFHDVPATSKILESYRKIPVSGFHPLTAEMRLIIKEANKPNKGGQKWALIAGPSELIKTPKKKKVKKVARKKRTPTPNADEGSHFDTISGLRTGEKVHIEEDDAIESLQPPPVSELPIANPEV